MLRSSVDLPQPDGPINAVIRPRRAFRSTSYRAWNVPYHRFSFSVRTAKSAWLAKAALHVLAGPGVLHGAGEQLLGLGDVDAAASQEHGRAIGQPPRLLDQIGDQHHGHFLTQASQD